MFRPALLAFAALAAGCASLVGTPRDEIVGYYAGWKDRVDVDPELLTVINYAFLDIGPDGAIVLVDAAADERHFARLAALKKEHPHLRLAASVGGWTRSYGFSDMAASAAARARFIDSTIAFLRRYGFDGIDLDWEYPGAIGVPCAAGRTCDRPGDKRNYVTLARELRAALDAAGRADGKRFLATIAAGADRKFLYDGASASWMVELAAALDWINLMTYDYHGTWETRSGMVAPLYRDPADPAETNVDATVTMYLEAGVPARSLALGMPFYGKGWIGCEPGPHGDGLYQACAAPVSDPAEATFEYWRLRSGGYLEGVAGRAFTRHWSRPAQVPWLYDPASRTFITYDDEASIRAKARYLKRRGLRGAMYWELASDDKHLLGTVIARELRE